MIYRLFFLPLQGVAGQEGDAERGQQHQLPPPDGAVRLARLRQPAHAHLLPQPAEGRDRIRPLRQAERRPGQSATEKTSGHSWCRFTFQHVSLAATHVLMGGQGYRNQLHQHLHPMCNVLGIFYFHPGFDTQIRTRGHAVPQEGRRRKKGGKGERRRAGLRLRRGGPFPGN